MKFYVIALMLFATLVGVAANSLYIPEAAMVNFLAGALCALSAGYMMGKVA